MNRDDIRGLIGGYAAGALTEAECRLLLEAALEDQELFEELAGEHALKQLLDSPGVKPRLLAALAPPPKRKLPAWAWVPASTVAAAVAALILIAVFRHPPVQQIAEVRVPISAPAPAPIPSSELSQATVQGTKVIRKAPAKPSSPVVLEKNAPEPPAPLETTTSRAESILPAATPQPQPLPPQPRLAPSPAVAGFRALPQALSVAAVERFAFSYEITQDGKLRVTPEANGFLSVITSNGASPQLTSANQLGRTGIPYEFEIPAGASVVTVVFSARQDTTTAASAVASPPADPPVGRKLDPSPSPESRLTAVIAVPPRAVR